MLCAFKGATTSAWIISSPEDADVIVVHGEDQDERIANWKSGGRLVVEIATNPSFEWSEQGALNESFQLDYPFRGAQVLALLEQLETQLISSPAINGVVEPPLSTAGDNVSWNFVEALRNLQPSSYSDVWFVACDANSPLLWLESSREVYVAEPAVVQDIRSGAVDLTELILEETPLKPDDLSERPAMELIWFAAYYASDRLAPWLDPFSRYRMTRWPDFGSIHPPVTQIRVAAALSADEIDVGEIAARARVSLEEATRTLNALSVCAVLVSATQTRPARLLRPKWSVPELRGGLLALVRNVRKHLGLGA